MNPFAKQEELMGQISQIVYDATDEGFTSAKLFVSIDFEEGESTAELSIVKDGREVSRVLGLDEASSLFDLSDRLHGAMKEHTGGVWTSYVLTLGEDGRVNVKYDYGARAV